MSKNVMIGPAYHYNSYNKTAGKYLDNTHGTYGQLSSPYTVSTGDKIEFTYRYCDPSTNSNTIYFFDGEKDDTNRAYILVYSGSGNMNAGSYENITLDGNPINSLDPLPHDLEEHTIIGYVKATSAGKKIHEIGRRHSHSNGGSMTIVSFKINDVEQKINWVGAVDVGGQSGPPIDHWFESVKLMSVGLNGLNDNVDYIIKHFGSSYTEIINSEIDISMSLSGGKVIFSEDSNFVFQDENSSGYGIRNDTQGSPVVYNNVTFDLAVAKDAGYKSIIVVDHYTHIELHNCKFYLNNRIGNAISFYNNLSDKNIMYRCLFKDSHASSSAGGIYLWNSGRPDGLYYVINCIFINMEYGIHNVPNDENPLLYYYNCYFDCYGADVVGPASNNIDLGGNVTSSDVSLVEAFVNHLIDDYTPNKILSGGVPPQINEDRSRSPYYTGMVIVEALLRKKLIKKIKRRKKRMGILL